MKDLLSKIKKEAEKSEQNYADLLEKFKALENDLQGVVGGVDIYASSKDIQLEQIDFDDYCIGHLSFNDGSISIHYLSTLDDFEEQMMQIPEEYIAQYNKVPIAKCKEKWLMKVSTKPVIESLLKSILKSLNSLNSDLHESVEVLSSLIDSNVEDFLNEVESTVDKFDEPKLSEFYKEARAQILTNPESSVTYSSSFIESVCKLIITKQGQNLPNNKDITSLFRTCLKCIKISPDRIASDDVRQISSGLKSIVHGIGSLRTHYSSAHGKTPGEYSINSSYAELCVNAASVIAKYLLEKHDEKMKSK